MTNSKVFVISLPHSVERKEHILKQMETNQVKFEFIEAVYGKEIDMDSDPRINYAEVKKYPDWLTPNMIGCGLSHIRVYQKIIEDNLDFAVVFEDDVVIGKDFINILNNIPKIIDKNCALLLYYQSWDTITLDEKEANPLFREYKVYDVDARYRLNSTGAYIITKDACRTMLEKTMPLHDAPDSWQYFFNCKAIEHIKIVYPQPVSTFEFQSTISSLKETGNRGWKYRILMLTEKYKIPLLYQLLKLRRKANKKNVQNIVLKK